MKFEIDEKRIESVCYKGKFGKKFIIFLEDGVVTDIVDTGVSDVGIIDTGTSVEDINAEREEILKTLKGRLNNIDTGVSAGDGTTTTVTQKEYSNGFIDYC